MGLRRNLKYRAAAPVSAPVLAMTVRFVNAPSSCDEGCQLVADLGSFAREAPVIVGELLAVRKGDPAGRGPGLDPRVGSPYSCKRRARPTGRGRGAAPPTRRVVRTTASGRGRSRRRCPSCRTSPAQSCWGAGAGGVVSPVLQRLRQASMAGQSARVAGVVPDRRAVGRGSRPRRRSRRGTRRSARSRSSRAGRPARRGAAR